MSGNPPFAPPRRDFIGKPAPPGYVAGIGRGATGFTTRSDIGPAREAAAAATAAAVAASAARLQLASSSSAGDESGSMGPPRKVPKKQNNDDDDEDEYLNESNYDDFAGYGGSLFNKDPYEDDDEEADKIYEQIDKHLDERGKALREAKTRQELERYRQERPKIQQQFSDLKASLKEVTESEWMSIPVVGDARNRKKRVMRQDKFTPVPDSLLAHQARIASGGEKLVYIDPKTVNDGLNSMDDDDEDANVDRLNEDQDNTDPESGKKMLRPNSTLALGDDRRLNIGEMSEFRSDYMSIKYSSLNANQLAINSQKADPQDYLTNLQSMVKSQITDASKLKDYREEFAAIRAANPTFENAWIISVRLEEAAGKIQAAKDLILRACEQCPKSADIWCEAIRLHSQDRSKKLIGEAIKANPRSEKLWIKAADLESEEDEKRKIYEKARDFVPKSVLLWKKSVELEGKNPTRARDLLREAVMCCPKAVDLWLALVKLEPYKKAREILIQKSKEFPAERSIWITAAKLEEAAGEKLLVGSIISASLEQLKKNGVEIKRVDWFREAVDAAKGNFTVTCHEIIKNIIGWNIGDQEDKLKIWLDDAQKFVANQSIDCAREVFKAIVSDKSYCRTESVWLAYADFERQHGNESTLIDGVLRQAVKSNNSSKSETLWLMLANERKRHLEETRQILSNALDANPDSEKIIIAAVEVECENGNYKEARRILADACMSAKTAQLVMKASKLEWSLGNLEEATRMLKAGTEEYKDYAEFYIMLGEIDEQRGDFEQAKQSYSAGLKFNPTSVRLWINMAKLEEKLGLHAKARSRLETARLRNPKVPILWLEAALLETRIHQAKNKVKGAPNVATSQRPEIVTTLLAKGIRECKDHPDLGLLLAEQDALTKRKY